VQTIGRSGVSAGSSLRRAWDFPWDREASRRFVRAHGKVDQECLVRFGARLSRNADASGKRYGRRAVRNRYLAGVACIP